MHQWTVQRCGSGSAGYPQKTHRLENPIDDPSVRGALTGEGFEAGQLANATAAGAAISRMAARFAAGDDALARLVRERQDATERWRKLDGTLVQAVSRPPGERDQVRESTSIPDQL